MPLFLHRQKSSFLMTRLVLFFTGDDVYVKSDQEKPAIYRIEKLWIDARCVDIKFGLIIYEVL